MSQYHFTQVIGGPGWNWATTSTHSLTIFDATLDAAPGNQTLPIADLFTSSNNDLSAPPTVETQTQQEPAETSSVTFCLIMSFLDVMSKRSQLEELAKRWF